MADDLGKELYDLFCDALKESHPEVKPVAWKGLYKNQKETWNLLQKKLNERG